MPSRVKKSATRVRRSALKSGDLKQIIKEVESGVINVSTAEILWGGPRGAGLVHTVAKLSESVETLSQTVTVLAGQVTGSNGVQAQLTDVKLDVSRLFGLLKWGGGIFATVVASGTVWLVGRSVQIALQGHV